MNSSYINKLVQACSFDMCASESNPEQGSLKCDHVQAFAETCYNYAKTQNKTFDFTGWRDIIDCCKIQIIFFFNSMLNKFFV